MKIRPARNAGSWYSGTAEGLNKQLGQECFLHSLGPGELPSSLPFERHEIVGLLCPHAGYMYSGPVAAHSYLALVKDHRPKSVVIVGPNHTGMGSGVSIMTEGIWRTPLGDVRIDADLARAIQKNSTYIDIEDNAHAYEHSIELQLPFLQFVFGSDIKFVPICMLMQDLDVALDVGQAVAKASVDREVTLIASSDMTHYEAQSSAEKKDAIAIDAMKSLDEKTLMDKVNRFNITMCGSGPTAAVIEASKILDASKGQLLKYATSGDITGDKSAVVGYCSMAFVRPRHTS